jgi:hypothetical protein
MLNRFLNYLSQDRYQEGCRDRDRGQLPRLQDSTYLAGYLKGRPRGLDDEIQYYPSLEAYFEAKRRHCG